MIGKYKIILILLFLTFSIGIARASSSDMSFYLSKDIVDANIGEVKTVEMKVKNFSQESYLYKTQIKTIQKIDEEGNYIYDASNVLSNWIMMSMPSNTLLPTFEVSNYLNIAVPFTTTPNEYLGDIEMCYKNLVSNIIKCDHKLIIIRVNGYAKNENLEITNFNIVNSVDQINAPVEMILEIKNTGDTSIIPKGKITIKQDDEIIKEIAEGYDENMNKNKFDFLNFNQNNEYILPSQVKRFIIPWSLNKRSGKVNIAYDIAYGEGKNLTGEKSFEIITPLRIENFYLDTPNNKFKFKIVNQSKEDFNIDYDINIYSGSLLTKQIIVSDKQNQVKSNDLLMVEKEIDNKELLQNNAKIELVLYIDRQTNDKIVSRINLNQSSILNQNISQTQSVNNIYDFLKRGSTFLYIVIGFTVFLIIIVFNRRTKS